MKAKKARASGANGRTMKPTPPPTTKRKPTKRLRAVLELYSKPDLARLLGVTNSAVHKWHDIPARFAVRLEKATGGKLKREFLAPDFYPRPAV